MKLFKNCFKSGLILGIVWIVALVVLAPIVFIYGGWVALTAYLTCKFTGVCPL